MTNLHTLNILIHVTTGCLAIIIGLAVLSRPKGTPWHRAVGRIALIFAGICVGGALIGAFVFRGRIDLIGVSLLVTYHIWSGVRSLRLKARGRRPADLVPATGILALGAAVAMLYAAGEGHYHWPAGLVYPSAGGLVVYGGWDVLRTLWPLSWRTALNPAEHAYKMTSLIGSLVSAAAVFAVLGLVLAARATRKAVGVTPSVALNARLKTDSEL